MKKTFENNFVNSNIERRLPWDEKQGSSFVSSYKKNSCKISKVSTLLNGMPYDFSLNYFQEN